MNRGTGLYFAAALLAIGGVLGCFSWFSTLRREQATAHTDPRERVDISPRDMDVLAGDGGGAAQVHFTIKNEGRDPVRIVRIGTSCGCTLPAPLKRRVLRGGESVDLEVRTTPPSVGEKTAYIEVFASASDAPVARAVLRLKGKAAIAPRILDAPQSVVLHGVFPDAVSGKFTLMTDEIKGQPEWIERIDADDVGITVRRDTVSEAPSAAPTVVRRVYHFVADAQPKQAGRGRLGRLKIMTRTQGGERLPSMTAMFDCKPPIEVNPGALFATVSDDQLPKTYQLFIRTHGSLVGASLEVVPSSHEWLQVGDLVTEGVGAPFVAKLPVTILSMSQNEGGTQWKSFHSHQSTRDRRDCGGSSTRAA